MSPLAPCDHDECGPTGRKRGHGTVQPLVRCALCRRIKGLHQAGTLNCPQGPKTRVGYVFFSKTNVYTPNEVMIRNPNVASWVKKKERQIDIIAAEIESLIRSQTYHQANAHVWRTRCKEAQRWLKTIPCCDDSPIAAARDAGKDE